MLETIYMHEWISGSSVYHIGVQEPKHNICCITVVIPVQFLLVFICRPLAGPDPLSVATQPSRKCVCHLLHIIRKLIWPAAIAWHRLRNFSKYSGSMSSMQSIWQMWRICSCTMGKYWVTRGPSMDKILIKIHDMDSIVKWLCHRCWWIVRWDDWLVVFVFALFLHLKRKNSNSSFNNIEIDGEKTA